MKYLLRHNARATLLRTLSLLVIAIATVTATSAALADPWDRGKGPRFSNGHRADVGRHVVPAARFNSRFDHHRDFRRNDFYGNRYRHNTRYDGWSVSLNLGSAWYGNHWSSGSLYYGSGLLGRPYFPYRNNTTIIYRQPSVVVVNDSSRVTGHVSERVIRSSRPAPSRSLLRDIHGDCWERTYDSRGVETRVQLPDSACQF